MSANRTEAKATGAIATREAENIQSPPPENSLTRMVAHVFAAAARFGAVGSDPFEAAVRAYMSCNSDMPHDDDAARVVADIICHRWRWRHSSATPREIRALVMTDAELAGSSPAEAREARR